MKRKRTFKKIGAFLLTLVLCLSMLPVSSVFASGGSVGMASGWGHILGGFTGELTLIPSTAPQKTLNLQNAGLNVKVTEEKKTELRKEAEQQYVDEFDFVFEELYAETKKVEDSTGVLLRNPDGSYNENWDAVWNKTHSDYSIQYAKNIDNDLLAEKERIKNSNPEKYQDKELDEIWVDGTVKEKILYKRLVTDTGRSYSNPLELYLRAWFTEYGKNPGNYDLYDGWANNTISVGCPQVLKTVNKDYDYSKKKWVYTYNKLYPSVGSTEWYEQVYDFFHGTSTDAAVAQTAERVKKHYVDAVYSRLLSEEINNQLGDQLKDAKFDFYVEPITSEEEQKATGVGTTIPVANEGQLQVVAGKFSDQTTDGKRLSTVDFGAKDQFYDSVLFDALEAINNSKNMTEFQNAAINSGIDRDLLTYCLLFDGGSLESESEPYVHKAGHITAGSNSLWPYESSTRGAQDLNWNSEWLGDYHILRATRGSGEWESWSFTKEIPLTGANWLANTGYNFFIPKFDSEGNLVSISKPLLNDLYSPEDYKKLVNTEDKAERAKIKTYGEVDEQLLLGDEEGSIAYDIDQTHYPDLTNALQNTIPIYRYKLTEKSKDSAKINDQPIVQDQEYSIVDVVPEYGIFFFNNETEANEFYQGIVNFIKTRSEDYTTLPKNFLNFNNSVAGAEFQPKAVKYVDNDNPDKEQTFNFELVDSNNKMVSTGINDGSSVTFTPIKYTYLDLGKTYTYTMREKVNDGDSTYARNQQVFTVEVKLDEKAGKKGNIGTTVTYKDEKGNKINGLPVFMNQSAGGLTVSKNVINAPEGTNDSEFQFTVKLSDETINGTYGDMTFVNGEATISLKNGESKTAKGLPPKTAYTVTETASPYYLTTTKTSWTEGSKDYQNESTGTVVSGTIAGKITKTAAFTNDYQTVDLSMQKVWNDDSNRDKLRPDAQTYRSWIKLYKVNGKTETDVTDDYDDKLTVDDNGNNQYSAAYTGLPKYDYDASGSPVEISYKIVEAVPQDQAENYTVSYTDADNQTADALTGASGNLGTITNTHEIEKTSISASKIWRDADQSKRLSVDNLKRRLTLTGSDGVDYSDKLKVEAIHDSSNTYRITAENLPKYFTNQNGQKESVVYTLTETAVDGYQTTYYDADGKSTAADGAALTALSGSEGSIGTIVNSQLTSVKVSKQWQDDNNVHNNRPASVEVQLNTITETAGNVVEKQAEGTGILTLSEDNAWTAGWDSLPIYDADGNKIIYSVKEVNVPTDYSVSYTAKNDSEFTVINTNSDKVDVSFGKIWNDSSDYDNIRPDRDEFIEKLHLIQVDADDNETEITDVEPTIETHEDGTDYITYKNLEHHDEQGRTVSYKLKEDAIEGYSTSIGGENPAEGNTVGENGILVNTHIPTTDISALKVWNDGSMIHPDAEQLKSALVLKAVSENGTTDVTEQYADKLEVQSAAQGANVYTISWTDLPKADAEGNALTYQISEDTSKLDGYTAAYTQNNQSVEALSGTSGNLGVITNTKTTSFTVIKSWDDESGRYGLRPDSITVQLYQGSSKYGDPVEIQADGQGQWTYTWNDLPKYDAAGKIIAYSVKENDVAGYTKSADTIQGTTETITNKLTTTDISAVKVWNDDGSSNRPDAETFKSALVLKAVSGNNTTDVTEKYADKLDVNSAAQGANVYTISWTGLPAVDAEGNAVTYQISEDTSKIEGYTAAYTQNSQSVEALSGTSGNLGVITNTRTGTTNLSFTKVWNDDNDRDGIRPSAGTFATQIHLYADENIAKDTEGNEYIPTITENTDGSWAVSYLGLPAYDSRGRAISYSLKEDDIDGYKADKTEYAAGETLTNTHETDTVDVAVSKSWNDDNNRDGIRPDTETFKTWIHLYKNEVKPDNEVTAQYKDKLTVTEETGQSSYKVEYKGLPENEGGQKITYIVVETLPDGSGYTTENNTAEDGGTITNNHEAETTDVTITKVWSDNGNQDGIRPSTEDFADWIKLVKVSTNGTETEVSGFTPTINDNSGSSTWTVTYSGLPAKENGSAIDYRVKEVIPQDTDYTADTDDPVQNGGQITNTHQPETVSIPVEKQWQDGASGTSVVVILTKNGEKTDQMIGLDADDNWKGSFDNLPKYENGSLIIYGVTEEESNYLCTVKEDGDGFILTNAPKTEETKDVSFTKVWNDDDYANRPTAEAFADLVHLFNDSGEVTGYEPTVTDNGDDTYTITYTDLPKYRADGTEINYYLTEEDMSTDNYIGTNEDGEEVSYYPMNGKEISAGQKIINTRSDLPTFGEKSVSVNKVWDDNDNQAGFRTENIYVQLYADIETEGEYEAVGDPAALNADNDWSYKWDALQEYRTTGDESDKNLIHYKVEEVSVPENYTSNVTESTTNDYSDAFTITNTYTPEKINIPVKKEWADGEKGEKADIVLMKNGEKYSDVITLNEDNNWQYTFEDLPKYDDDGNEINYTVEEENVDYYYNVVKNEDGSFTVTNYATKIDIPVEKRWAEGASGEKAVIVLKNGDEIIDRVELNESNGWKHVFTDLPKYDDNGNVINYTVDEETDSYRYEITSDGNGGWIITNYPLTEQTAGNVKTGVKTPMETLPYALGCLAAVGIIALISRRKSAKKEVK